MTTNGYYAPMTDVQSVIMIVYDGFELLDLAGPTGVFNAANSVSGAKRYTISVHSENGGTVNASCGIPVETESLPDSSRFGSNCTTLVVGAEGKFLTDAMNHSGLGDWIQKAAIASGRFGSVCSGAFILANAGVLDGRQAATHWAGGHAFARWFPQVVLDREALYVVDGSIWTSAGVTTGIDMALAMVGQDYGPQLKGDVAGHLVIYKHRPGFQTQFSTLLSKQISMEDPFGPTAAWVDANLHRQIVINDLANVAGMSPRTFQRKFKEVTGQTPARFVLELRMEKAKDMLSCGQSVKSVGPAVGFASETAFRTAFRKYFGTVPSQFAATTVQ